MQNFIAYKYYNCSKYTMLYEQIYFRIFGKEISNTIDNITEKVDVYSFGIIIWEMYSRTQPYKGMSVSQIINFVCF